MKHLFLIGSEFHKAHVQFVKKVVSGEYLEIACSHQDTSFSQSIFEQDDKDVLWYFADYYPNLHPHLKGKQIFLNHGLGFKPVTNPEKKYAASRYFDAVFSSGAIKEQMFLEMGILKERIYPIGYPILLDIPNIEVRPRSILFSSTCYWHWNHYKNLEKILKRLSQDYHGYLTLHPDTPAEMQSRFQAICREKNNITLISTQEELNKAYAYCEMAVGGSSSVLTPFWFLKKPVILLKGWTNAGRNPLSGFKWHDIKQRINSPLFNEILDESQKISHWLQFSEKTLAEANWAPSSEKIFYPWSSDSEVVTERILSAVRLISEAETVNQGKAT